MTPQEAARRVRVLRQSARQVLELIEASTLDATALLRAADTMGDAYRLALSGVMALAYDEAAGVTISNEAGTFSARIYEIGDGGMVYWQVNGETGERPFGAGMLGE